MFNSKVIDKQTLDKVEYMKNLWDSYISTGVLPPANFNYHKGIFVPVNCVTDSVFNSTWLGEYSYNGNLSSGWVSGSGNAYIIYEFDNPVCLSFIKTIFVNATTTNRTNGGVTVLGSNDNTNFIPITNLMTGKFLYANNVTIVESYFENIPMLFNLDDDVYYKYIKISITSDTQVGIREIQFMGKEKIAI